MFSHTLRINPKAQRGFSLIAPLPLGRVLAERISTEGEASSNALQRARKLAMAGPSAADDDKAIEGLGSGASQKPTGKKITDSKNLEKVLKMFRAQLNFQQQQLDLFQGLSPSIEPTKPPPVLTLRDCERALRRMEKKGLKSVYIKEISTSLIKHCCDG
jgi:hypothetical protein